MAENGTTHDVADDDGDDTTTVGDDNDIGEDEDTSSEPEEATPVISKAPVVAPVAIPVKSKSPDHMMSSKMRIKLKMPKISASGLPAHRRAPVPSNGETSHRALPLAKKSMMLPTAAARKKKPPKVESGEPSKPSKMSAEKPKSRIRSLKLPLSKKTTSGDSTVLATVLNSDDDDEDMEGDTAVATVVSSSAGNTASGSNKAAGRRRSTQPVRVRIPPLLSPGLRVAPSQSTKQQQQQQESTYATPAEVFNHSMGAAGYTTEARTKRPHRGSSTTRVVGDMFDSNVKLCLHFPPLVPTSLRESQSRHAASDETSKPHDDTKEEPNLALPDRLIRAMRKTAGRSSTDSPEKKNGKRPRSWGLREMLPVSLTIPYPASYIQQQQEYVKQVEGRERSIRRKQEADEEADMRGNSPPNIAIPPIPELPPPPKMTDQPGFLEDHKDNYPLYPPNTQRDFTRHLDQDCFHVSQGRYFGLSSNKLADPMFVGANAPGIAGVNASGSGLAISTAGSHATALILTSAFYDASLDATKPPNTFPEETKDSEPEPIKEVVPASKVETNNIKPSAKETKKTTTTASSTPTASTSMLRKIMDQGGSSSSALRQSIIRAAVHASRTGNHGQAFKGGDRIFPDVSKAFAAYAGVKPCQRCKNNKQGAYHCRLRRRHLENDFDGGDSAKELRILFELPLDELE